MKERPILFSGAMVRALLAGTKTQTRRVVKPQPSSCGHFGFDDKQRLQVPTWDGLWLLPCPYGQPGDRLWVREAWAEVARAEPRTDEDLPWREDGRIVVYAAGQEWDGARQFLCADGVLRWAKPDRWKPSIHMPRWASRITLEVTGVRVERLQDISEADAIAEGVSADKYAGLDRANARAYSDLWESINGPGSWDANPWVWCVSFRRKAA